jgi:oligopeptide transport system substrate-binding protein
MTEDSTPMGTGNPPDPLHGAGSRTAGAPSLAKRPYGIPLRRMLRRSPALACLLAVMALLAGCGKSDPAAAAKSNLTKSGTLPPNTLLFGNGTEPQDIDPQIVTGVPEHKILMALFEGLVTENPKDLSPEPGCADRWEISPDGLVYTFHLRGDLKWSDGTPLTAGTFIRSFQRMLTPSLAAEYSYLLHFVTNAKDYNEGKIKDFSQVGFKAPDDRTLVVTLNSPTPFLLKIIASHYSWYPVPIHVIEKFGGLDRKGTAWTRPGNFVSNGAFKLKEWRQQQVLIAERNPNYWDRQTVKLDAIHFLPVENQDTEERMFRTGQLDMTNELPLAKIDVYRKEYPHSLRTDPYLGIYFYRLNNTRPPLNDKRVRRALALAIDRESLVKNVVRGGQQPAYSISYPGTAGYTPEAKLTGTVEDAKRLLAEAGFPNGQGFPKLELLYNTSQNHRVIAEAIQQMWRRNLNIDIGLRNEEWKVYLDSQDNKAYDIERAGWIADYVDPHVFLEIWGSDNLNNDTGFANAQYDDLLQQALRAKDDTERYAIYQKMDALLVEELPVIPIYFYTRVAAMSPKVKGYYPTLLDNHPFKYVSVTR